MNTIALLPSEEAIELARRLKKRGYEFPDFEFELMIHNLLDPAYEQALAECGIVDEEAQKYLDGWLDFPELVQDKVDGWAMDIWKKTKVGKEG